MRRYILCICSFIFTTAAFSQAPPPPLQSLIDKGQTIVNERDLTVEQKQFYAHNSTVDKDGFFRISNTTEYINLIVDFREIIRQQNLLPGEHPAPSLDLALVNYPTIGAFREDSNRTTTIFGSDSDHLMMFTVWNYEKAGARMFLVNDFSNQRVMGIRAVLSLSTAPGLEKCLWKLTWVNEGNSFELYLTDKVNTLGIPTRRVSELINFGEKAFIAWRADANVTKTKTN